MHDPIITESTRRSYAYAWERYSQWCADAGRDQLDGDPDTVVAFLLAMNADGLKPTTLQQWRYGISHRYATDPLLLGRDDPTKTDAVRACMKRIDRAAARDGRGPRSVNALTLDLLEQVLEVSAVPRSHETAAQAHRRHVEMNATLRLMYDSALRADEMARAEWTHLSPEPAANGHRTLHIPVSKTDQNGNGRYGNVSPTTWAALQRWGGHTDADPVRICTAPSAHALSGRIQRLGKVAGVKLSGHSPRRGVATDLGRAGKGERAIMAVGGWKSSAMVGRYVDAPNAARNAVCDLYDGQPEPVADDNVIQALRGFFDTEARTLNLLRWESALAMARKLGAKRDHPAVVAIHAEIAEQWPARLAPPPPCAWPDCPGMILTADAKPGKRWCIVCRGIVENVHRRANLKDQT